MHRPKARGAQIAFGGWAIDMFSDLKLETVSQDWRHCPL